MVETDMCTLEAVMDWDLGIAESIAGIIVIGFSVDYVVHLAHMYMDGFHVGGFSDRDSRISYALEKMGGTVFAGAVTTARVWRCHVAMPIDVLHENGRVDHYDYFVFAIL